MAKGDWIIGGPDGQAVIDADGSKRCQLSGTKYMLWNGRNNLTNAEVISLLKPYINNNNGYQVGGMVLRSNSSTLSCYRLLVYGFTNYRTYYIHRIINGVTTLLTQITTNQAYNLYIKTRFRIDDFQISIDEYSNQWDLLTTVEDTNHSLITGYAGIISANVNSSYSFLFDDIEISER